MEDGYVVGGEDLTFVGFSLLKKGLNIKLRVNGLQARVERYRDRDRIETGQNRANPMPSLGLA